MFHILLILSTITVSLFSTSIQTDSGWNLIGSNKNNIQIESSFSTCNSVWSYNNGWKAVSPNKSLNSSLSQAKIPILQTINAGEGFWINCNEPLSFNFTGDIPSDTEFKIDTSGWHLKALKESNSVDPVEYFKNSNITTLWKYTSNGWEAYSPNIEVTNTLQEANITTIKTLHPNEGFWINSNIGDNSSFLLNPIVYVPTATLQGSINLNTLGKVLDKNISILGSGEKIIISSNSYASLIPSIPDLDNENVQFKSHLLLE